MDFEWDEEKERINIAKHGLDFELAAQVFFDPNRIEVFDELHSLEEDRYKVIGEIGGSFLILCVIYTERRMRVRIISARKATKKEKEAYHDYKKKHIPTDGFDR